eukprot:3372093-Pleurochrysis_carterae.AAC.1
MCAEDAPPALDLQVSATPSTVRLPCISLLRLRLIFRAERQHIFWPSFSADKHWQQRRFKLSYVGFFAIRFFCSKGDSPIPRPHGLKHKGARACAPVPHEMTAWRTEEGI